MAEIEEKKKEKLLNPSVIVFAVLAVITAAMCYARGREVFIKGVDDTAAMMVQVLPKLVGALLMSGFVQVLVPREHVVKLMGEKSGFKGLMIAGFAGILTPGGPMISFPLISTLYGMGANIGPLVVYLLSWELLGVQRILVWEIPLLGVKFSMLRMSVSLLLPLLAGVLAQRLAHYVAGGNEKGGR